MLRAWAGVTEEPQPPESQEGAAAPDQPAPPVAGVEPVPASPPTDEAAARAAAEAAAKAAELKALDEELKTLQRHVTLGKWTDVRTYLAGIPADEGKAGFAQMLRSLAQAPPPPGGGGDLARMQIPNVGPVAEQNVFALDDLVGLAAACPHEKDRPTVTLLGPIMRQVLQGGVLSQTAVARLERESARPAEEIVLTKQHCAWLLVAANLTVELEKFLPAQDEAIAAKDAESLLLLAQCLLAQHARDKKPELLERAWSAVQPVLDMPDVKDASQQEALKMAVALAPRIREDLGLVWLEASFAREPERGMEILAATGASASAGLLTNAGNADERLQNLRLQKTAVESLLEKAPDRAGEWQETLRVLAYTWLREAEASRAYDQSSSMNPRLQRDVYGNYFYLSDDGEMMMGGRRPSGGPISVIKSADMLDVAPSEAWLARVDDSQRPRFEALQAQLYLKVSEDEEAFPYIERLAVTHPDVARDLVHEFIRVWTRNHDPNSSTRYTSPYMYMYGFEMRANGIPLTRSKQVRNVEELAEWVARIRKLPITDLDESLFARAFTACHSSAEVYRVEDIEDVFGAIGNLDAKTLAELVHQMRTNLAAIWRIPAVQEQAKTQRKQKDIEAEVLRGYDVARQVVADGLAKYEGDWRLHLAQACVLLDETQYQNELAPSSEFSERRLSAIDQFRAAAELYAKQVPTLPEEDQTAEPFERWFYAGLGASDIGGIDHRSTPDPRQPPLIAAALRALPGESAEKHVNFFANSLFTRMSSLKPTVKFAYLKAGFEIVGDAEPAAEARKVYDYYNDLVTEINLVTRVDGSARVGHDGPFGVFVELHHTVEIERESGGFGKYLQNQNSMSYAWNYGRPLENYREKFEESVRTLLEEQFEVLSVTFQEKDVNSRSGDQAGWRVTPYAYLLLKPRGPEIDKLPALKMDLDFLDTSGYVVLPVTSPQLPIDAAPDKPDARPYANLTITQTLDERQAAEGKLVLEVKAVSQGLVPPLEEIVDVRASDFEVTETEDQGVLISKFDPDSSEPAVISERTWMVSYAGRQDLAALPTEFRFPEPKVEVKESSFLRYEDADLKSVEAVVSLEREYGEVRQTWPWVVAIGVLALVAAFFGYRALTRRPVLEVEAGPQLPETLTPFNVLALLRRIEANNGFDPNTKRELATNIQTLERYYFAGGEDQPPDLRGVAERWVRRG